MINLTNTLAPSGAFCAQPAELVGGVNQPENYIYNPGVLEYHRGSYTIEERDAKATSWITECNKIPLIAQADINAYGQTCIQLAQNLSHIGGNLRLGPLRGAVRPCLLMDAMTQGAGDFTFFNYKAGCQPENAERVKADLRPILLAANPHNETYRIQVVDTAIGGHGINALTSYLRELKEKQPEFRKQKWVLDLHIIHATDGRTDIGNIEKVKSQFGAGVFEVQLQRYVVPDLIVEDYEAALGLDITSDHGKILVKQSYQPGQFLLKCDDGSRLVKSEALVVTFDELFSQSITDEMLHNQNLNQVGVVWKDYQQKG